MEVLCKLGIMDCSVSIEYGGAGTEKGKGLGGEKSMEKSGRQKRIGKKNEVKKRSGRVS
jgi:hypothetical protein